MEKLNLNEVKTLELEVDLNGQTKVLDVFAIDSAIAKALTDSIDTRPVPRTLEEEAIVIRNEVGLPTISTAQAFTLYKAIRKTIEHFMEKKSE